MSQSSRIWTIGHSNHTREHFLNLLRREQIEFLVDVRSFPYSKFAPQFNAEAIEAALNGAGIRYVFMGEVLGGRPSDADHFDEDGHALYGRMARLPAFKSGVDRLVHGSTGKHRLAIMCSCGKPDHCHRRLLVGKVLTESGVELRHILPSGGSVVEQHVQIGPQDGLFGGEESLWRSTQSVSQRRRLNTSSAA